MPEANRRANGHNPLCGDRATVYLHVEGDVVRDVSFEGSGCSISTASASMMTDALKGKTVAEAEALFERFHELVTADPSKAATAAAELGQARRLRRGPRVPDAGEVRLARLAHDEGRPRGRRTRPRRSSAMVTREARTLSRDVEVAAIPYGDRLTLTMGTTVFITQALGGSYTAMTDHGYLVRIEGKDADAIGEKPVAAA